MLYTEQGIKAQKQAEFTSFAGLHRLKTYLPEADRLSGVRLYAGKNCRYFAAQ